MTATPRTIRIGLTGPIGCGKSTVAGWLGELGAVVVDADAIARVVTAPGEPAHDAILGRFGAGVRAPDGTLDRAALGRIAFSDPVALRELEEIVHPATRPRILAAIEAAERSGAPAVVVEAIKLVEGGLAVLCDEVWLVTCAPAVQRLRLAGRGMAVDAATQRMAAQVGLTERLRPSANRILDTSGSLAEARAWVIAALGGAIVAAGQ